MATWENLNFWLSLTMGAAPLVASFLLKGQTAKIELNTYEDLSKDQMLPEQIKQQDLCQLEKIMREGLSQIVGATVVPAAIFAFLLAVFCKLTLDDEGLWWYFTSAILGMLTAIVVAFLVSGSAAEATVKTAWKSRLTVKYAHKVCHRTGMQALFLACGLGTVTMLVLFYALENWYGASDPEKLTQAVQVLWPFALNVAAVAVFFRVSGIIYERTVTCGEVLILHGSEPDAYIKNPASTTYNIGQLSGQLVGTSLDYYALFVGTVVASLTFNANCKEVVALDGGAYYPLVYASLVVCSCFAASLATQMFNTVSESEDHYFVENISRMQLFYVFGILAPLTIIFHNFGLPEELTVGFADFPAFSMEKPVPQKYFTFCSLYGLLAGLAICLLSEYFTSMNCPPSQNVAESSQRGLPVNILKANSQANVFTMCTLLILVIFVQLCLHYAGGLGLSYGLMGLIAYQIVAGVIHTAGGISGSAFRVTKIISQDFNDQIFAQELDCGSRQMSYVSRGMNIFMSVCLSFLLLGYGLSLSQTKVINILDPVTFGSFIVGAAFPFAISNSFLKLVEVNVDEMMSSIYQQFSDNQKYREQTEMEQQDLHLVQESTNQNTAKKLWEPGFWILVVPFLIGLFFMNDKIWFGFSIGAVFVGFFLAITNTVMSGILESSKEWLIQTRKFNLNEEELGDSDEKQIWISQEQTLMAAKIGGALGVSQKDLYVFYSIMTQTLCLLLCVFYISYHKYHDWWNGLIIVQNFKSTYTTENLFPSNNPATAAGNTTSVTDTAGAFMF